MSWVLAQLWQRQTWPLAQIQRCRRTILPVGGASRWRCTGQNVAGTGPARCWSSPGWGGSPSYWTSWLSAGGLLLLQRFELDHVWRHKPPAPRQKHSHILDRLKPLKYIFMHDEQSKKRTQPPNMKSYYVILKILDSSVKKNAALLRDVVLLQRHTECRTQDELSWEVCRA